MPELVGKPTIAHACIERSSGVAPLTRGGRADLRPSARESGARGWKAIVAQRGSGRSSQGESRRHWRPRVRTVLLPVTGVGLCVDHLAVRIGVSWRFLLAFEAAT